MKNMFYRKKSLMESPHFNLFICAFATLLSLFAGLLSHDPHIEFLEERLCICGDKTQKAAGLIFRELFSAIKLKALIQNLKIFLKMTDNIIWEF
jgi:hypothetical protein